MAPCNKKQRLEQKNDCQGVCYETSEACLFRCACIGRSVSRRIGK
jgi:hypothetical protein